MTTTWYATLSGDVIGPLTPAQLQVFVERGWIEPDTPVRHDRMRRFVPASEVVGLLRGGRPMAVVERGAEPRGVGWWVAVVVSAATVLALACASGWFGAALLAGQVRVGP